MIAAIYARKSTDQNLPDVEKSVTRQIAHATAYATRKGWTVAPAHVYQDDGISGAEFVKRPGFLQLMNALKPRPPFQYLLVMDQSRLGRSLDEVPFAIKRITDAGVRIFCYLADSEVKRESAADKFMVHAIAFVDDMHRQQSRERTHDALKRKMLAGYVAGGCVYGYRNVEVRDAQGRRLHVTYEIEPTEAAVLRRIFEAVVAGQGFSRIAKALNADGVRTSRGGSWDPSMIREAAYRPTYRGQRVWNKTGWVDRDGTKKKVDRPESEWLRRDAAELRIIPEPLWLAAHARVRASAAVYRRRHAPPTTRPAGAWGRYLLSGFTECALCHGAMLAWGKAGKGPAAFRCAYHHRRGVTVCPNANTAPVHTVTTAVLDGLRRQVLAPDVLGPVLRETLVRYQARTVQTPGSRRELEHRRAQIAQELERLTTALAHGGPLASIVAKIQEREAAHAAVAAQLAALAALDAATRRQDPRAVERRLRTRLTEFHRILAGNVEEAREVLRQLLPERLRFTPRQEGGYRITGHVACDGIFAALVDGPHIVVPPG